MDPVVYILFSPPSYLLPSEIIKRHEERKAKKNKTKASNHNHNTNNPTTTTTTTNTSKPALIPFDKTVTILHHVPFFDDFEPYRHSVVPSSTSSDDLESTTCTKKRKIESDLVTSEPVEQATEFEKKDEWMQESLALYMEIVNDESESTDNDEKPEKNQDHDILPEIIPPITTINSNAHFPHTKIANIDPITSSTPHNIFAIIIGIDSPTTIAIKRGKFAGTTCQMASFLITDTSSSKGLRLVLWREKTLWTENLHIGDIVYFTNVDFKTYKTQVSGNTNWRTNMTLVYRMYPDKNSALQGLIVNEQVKELIRFASQHTVIGYYQSCTIGFHAAPIHQSNKRKPKSNNSKLTAISAFRENSVVDFRGSVVHVSSASTDTSPNSQIWYIHFTEQFGPSTVLKLSLSSPDIMSSQQPTTITATTLFKTFVVNAHQAILQPVWVLKNVRVCYDRVLGKLLLVPTETTRAISPSSNVDEPIFSTTSRVESFLKAQITHDVAIPISSLSNMLQTNITGIVRIPLRIQSIRFLSPIASDVHELTLTTPITDHFYQTLLNSHSLIVQCQSCQQPSTPDHNGIYSCHRCGISRQDLEWCLSCINIGVSDLYIPNSPYQPSQSESQNTCLTFLFTPSSQPISKTPVQIEYFPISSNSFVKYITKTNNNFKLSNLLQTNADHPRARNIFETGIRNLFTQKIECIIKVCTEVDEFGFVVRRCAVLDGMVIE